MVVGMIHATPAFNCCDLPLSEYWLKASKEGGKADVDDQLTKVCELMAQQKLSSLPSVASCVSKNAESAKQRGDDYRRHQLYDAAAIEYSNAYFIHYGKLISGIQEDSVATYRAMVSVMIDRMCTLNEARRWKEAAADAIEILNRSLHQDDSSEAAAQAQIRAVIGRIDRNGKCNFVLTVADSNRFYWAFLNALVELNWHGDYSTFWNAYTSLSTEQFNYLIKLLVVGLLTCKEYGGRCLALLARASRTKPICVVMFHYGALSCLIATISSMLTPGSKSAPSGQLAPDSSLNYYCCNGCVVIANIIRYMPSRVTSEIILSSNGLLLLVRLTCSGWEAVVGDSAPFTSHVNCSREGVQALANLAIIANER